MAFSYREYFIKLPIGTKLKMLSDDWYTQIVPGDVIQLMKLELDTVDGINPHCNFRRLARPDAGRMDDDDRLLTKRRIDEVAMERVFNSVICQKHF